jgi:hypothetical protein
MDAFLLVLSKPLVPLITLCVAMVF